MESTVQTTPQSLVWDVYKKTAFRFVFIYFILFIIFLDWSVNSILAYLYYDGHLSDLLDTVIRWVGKYLFHIPYTIVSPYDGQHNDRTYVYLLYFTIAVIAVLGTIIWSALDRKRENYDVLYYWLTAIVRYYVAFTLFIFALEKFFKMQFPDLSLYTLTQPVGDMSPMSLAWTFYGYSYGYNIFMGIAESAALLLLFRRTMTLGAILTLAALANVIAVNYSYDLHAKVYPAALFVMTFFLLLHDGDRLIRIFFTGQTTSIPVIKAPVFKKRWMNISKLVLKILIIGFYIILPLHDYWSYRKYLDASNSKSKISGVYDVDTFVTNKDTLSTEDPLRWSQLVIGGRWIEAVRFHGDSIAFIEVSVDKKEILISGNEADLAARRQEIHDELGIAIWDDKMDSLLITRQIMSRLHFELSDSTTLSLKGKIEDDSVFITAKKRPIRVEDFRLMKSRIHWVNEASYVY